MSGRRTRVLLVRASAMGDVVQTLGAVRALAAARRDLELHYLTQRENVPLFASPSVSSPADAAASPAPELVASVHVHTRRPAVRGFVRSARLVRALAPQIAIDLQGNWKSALLVRASGARRRIGAFGPARREPRSAMLLNERVAIDGVPHPARIAAALLATLEPSLAPEPPRLDARSDEIADGEASLAALGVAPDALLDLLVVGRPEDARTWPLDAMERHRAGALAEGRTVVLLRGPAERGVVVPSEAPLLDHGPGSLRRLIGLGHALARRGARVFGPDQGTLHVLAACGADVTLLAGPFDPERTAPPRARVLGHLAPPPCRPCAQHHCYLPEGNRCMQFTPAEGVRA